MGCGNPTDLGSARFGARAAPGALALLSQQPRLRGVLCVAHVQGRLEGIQVGHAPARQNKMCRLLCDGGTQIHVIIITHPCWPN